MTRAYHHRAAFGCWINDMRNKSMPYENWPYGILDDQTAESIIGCLELQRQAGFNEFCVFGLLATRDWPMDISSAASADRRQKVNRILKAAHERGIKVNYGLGVYSWGFDEIIKNCPDVRGPNPGAMCGSSPRSWEWMKKVMDFILAEFDIDGFHLEASDQGRCTCPSCAKQGNVEYYSRLNGITAEYIRSKFPDKILMVNMCGYIPFGSHVSDEDKKHLVTLSRHLDYLIDAGHRGCFIEENSRPEFIRALKCDFGTSGGTWVYPPQRWNRLRWFLPHTMRTDQHIRQLYGNGGRAVEYYMGPTINPGVEVNIAFGGRILSDVSRKHEEVLSEVLETLYKPKTTVACSKIVRIFKRAENAYFGHWSVDRIVEHDKMPPPGELHPIVYLLGRSPGPAAYLRDPYMNSQGRTAYRKELISILDDTRKIENDIGDNSRLRRIKTCIKNVVKDIGFSEKAD